MHPRPPIRKQLVRNWTHKFKTSFFFNVLVETLIFLGFLNVLAEMAGTEKVCYSSKQSVKKVSISARCAHGTTGPHQPYVPVGPLIQNRNFKKPWPSILFHKSFIAQARTLHSIDQKNADPRAYSNFLISFGKWW